MIRKILLICAALSLTACVKRTHHVAGFQPSVVSYDADYNAAFGDISVATTVKSLQKQRKPPQTLWMGVVSAQKVDDGIIIQDKHLRHATVHEMMSMVLDNPAAFENHNRVCAKGTLVPMDLTLFGNPTDFGAPQLSLGPEYLGPSSRNWMRLGVAKYSCDWYVLVER